jgi:hypothetical protein
MNQKSFVIPILMNMHHQRNPDSHFRHSEPTKAGEAGCVPAKNPSLGLLRKWGQALYLILRVDASLRSAWRIVGCGIACNIPSAVQKDTMFHPSPFSFVLI